MEQAECVPGKPVDRGRCIYLYISMHYIHSYMTVRTVTSNQRCSEPESPALNPSGPALAAKISRRVRGLLGACLVLATVLLCGLPARAEQVMIFAAASTTDAVSDIIDSYRDATGAEIVASFAASSALARQIENGAPAHLFLSASPVWMDYLEARSLLTPESRRDRLGNRLALIAPSDSAITVSLTAPVSFSGLLGDGHLAMADPDHVPAGIYGKEALETLGAWRDVSPKVVRGNNVRATLALVERGEVPLGIVYQTDATTSERCRVVALFPESTHAPIRYPLALVAGQETADARAFYDHLLSPDAAEIFAQHGFTVR